MNIVRHFEDAENVTQEVFTTVYTSLENFNGTSKLSIGFTVLHWTNPKNFYEKNKTKTFWIYDAMGQWHL